MGKVQLSLISLLVTVVVIALATSVYVSSAAAEVCIKIKGFYMVEKNGECEEHLPSQDGNFQLALRILHWLANGADITTAKPIDIQGEVLFENVLNGATILCSSLFEGTIGPNSGYEVTKAFDLEGKEIKELEGNGIKCSSVKICEAGDAELWPENLPYKGSLLFAPEVNLFFMLVEPNGSSKLPVLSVLCLVLGLTVTESCETVVGAVQEVSNAATDVEIMGAITPLATCNGNAEDGLVENNASNVTLISLVSGETLAVSE